MSNRLLETLTGALVLAFAALALAYGLWRPGQGGQGTGYTLYADFQDASDIRAGTAVEIAGVPIGRVSDVHLTEFHYARVAMRIDGGIAIPVESELAWTQPGLLGAPRLNVLVFEDSGEMLQDGDFFDSVRPAYNLIEGFIATSGGDDG